MVAGRFCQQNDGSGLRTLIPDSDRPGPVDWVQHSGAVRYLLNMFDTQLMVAFQCALPEELRSASVRKHDTESSEILGKCPAEALNELDWWISGWLAVRKQRRIAVPANENWLGGGHDMSLSQQLSTWPLREVRKHRIVAYFAKFQGIWGDIAEAFSNDPVTIREGMALAQAYLNGPREHWLQAESTLRATLADLERTTGVASADSSLAAHALAKAIKQLRGLGGISGVEVESLLRRAASGLSKALGPHHADVTKVEWELAEVRLELKRMVEL